jgi:hypothetical protein
MNKRHKYDDIKQYLLLNDAWFTDSDNKHWCELYFLRFLEMLSKINEAITLYYYIIKTNESAIIKD